MLSPRNAEQLLASRRYVMYVIRLHLAPRFNNDTSGHTTELFAETLLRLTKCSRDFTNFATTEIRRYAAVTARTATLRFLEKLKSQVSIDELSEKTAEIALAVPHDTSLDLFDSLATRLSDDEFLSLILRSEGHTFTSIAAHLEVTVDEAYELYRIAQHFATEAIDEFNAP
ncbi:MAG: hypothetical protein KDA88_07690 [Planctomycetaceae bacterium]|nr:hypothetical protein [Planctomycetaceae bacterium]MCB9949530.1 hypothetical protein [Planctomycetaceae bacterium]